MKFDIKNPNSKNYAVYLNGELQKYAVEADDETGIVRTRQIWGGGFFGRAKVNKRENKHGRVHITKMEGYELEEYRDKALIKIYYEGEEDSE